MVITGCATAGRSAAAWQSTESVAAPSVSRPGGDVHPAAEPVAQQVAHRAAEVTTSPGAGTPTAVDTTTGATDGANPGPQIPGMYGLTRIGQATPAGSVAIGTPQSCDFVVQVLRSGQWRVTDTVTRDGPQHSWYQGALTMGQRAGVFQASQTPSGCSGSITMDRQIPVSMSGAITASGTGRFLQAACVRDQDASASSASTLLFLYGLYVIDGHIYLAEGMFHPEKGRHVSHLDTATLSGSGDSDTDLDAMTLTEHLPGDATEAATALALNQAAQGDAKALTSLLHGSDPDSWPLYAAGSHVTETVTITSTDPLQGTVAAQGLHETNHPKGPELSFTLPFTCAA